MKQNNIDKFEEYPTSNRLPCVRLLELTIQHWSSNSSVRLVEDEDRVTASRCVILRTGH